MEGSDTVDSVGADDRQKSHSDLLIVSLLNQGHSSHSISVSWEVLLDLLKEEEIDQVNKVEMSGE